ncbi:hypothetical protein EIN_116720 [Entamoeba invadens IP1]|uniref:RBR-type E3 ubiquitin transferase n=1 Tax=Entamoeba invadens IP1 TaxID=370355 RepID=L7FNR0_ENTIV|nr:hypothetical protein EIN_116720 [Entamoeba invadens IP1]ELP94541.1 hypothetical protein EIN_116720 [Entamoeba invadens IP1]|eukprot:XP_004261312.1 hypothetical protein EIN_116720 [Entamoeba invadens IP1]
MSRKLNPSFSRFNPFDIGGIKDDKTREEVILKFVHSYEECINITQREQKTTELCQKCFSQIKISQLVPFDGCGHVLCRSCMIKHIAEQIEGPNPYIQCFFQECNNTLNNSAKLLHDGLITQKQRDVMEEKMVGKYLKDHGFSTCPHCNNPIPGNTQGNNNIKRTCAYCGNKFCYNCREKTWHEEFTCAQYKSYKNMAAWLRTLYENGMEFIRNTPNCPEISQNSIIQFNTQLLKNCNAMTRFSKMVSLNNFDVNNGFFTWHGSPENGVQGICNEGFDPHRRSGQAYGTGEYFGIQPQTSFSYCQNGSHLILTYVLNGNQVRTQPGFCYIINNPIDWNTSYCLPLFVISFRNHAAVSWLPENTHCFEKEA